MPWENRDPEKSRHLRLRLACKSTNSRTSVRPNLDRARATVFSAIGSLRTVAALGKEERSLTTFAAVGLIFGFGFSCCKPLHIAYVVGSTAGERLPIGDYVSWSPISVAALAHKLRFRGSGCGVGFCVFLCGLGIGVRFGSACLLSSKAEWKNHANEERDYRFPHGMSLYQQGSGVKLNSEREPHGEHRAVVVRVKVCDGNLDATRY